MGSPAITLRCDCGAEGRAAYGEVWKCSAPGGLTKAIKFVAASDSISDVGCAATQELQAQTVTKVTRARQTVEDTRLLLGEDLLTATFWMDVRRAQSPGRDFGRAPTAAWSPPR